MSSSYVPPEIPTNKNQQQQQPPSHPSSSIELSSSSTSDAPGAAGAGVAFESRGSSLVEASSQHQHQPPLSSAEEKNADPNYPHSSTVTSTTTTTSTTQQPQQRLIQLGGESSTVFPQVEVPLPELPITQDHAAEGEEPCGGRLWELAGRQVAAAQAARQQQQQGQHHVGGGRRMRTLLRETFMERMRSRANPDAPIATTAATPPRGHGESSSLLYASVPTNATNQSAGTTAPSTTTTMVKLDAQDTEFLLHSGSTYAQKRVKVAQLLLIGILGVLLGWLGNSVVGTSCHFASVQIQVGQYGDVFPLHFGLYKYSTVDSSLNGYKYCYPYSAAAHQQQPSTTSRAANGVALAAGTYSLVVLWWYLIVGQFRRVAWNWAVWSAVVAGLAQVLTLISFFWVGDLCRTRTCTPGPAAVLAIITAAVWIALAYELQYNMPTDSAAATLPSSLNDDGGDTTPHGKLLLPDHHHHVDPTTTTAAAIPSTARLSSSASSKQPHQEEQGTIAAHLEMADLAVASAEYMERWQ